MARLLILLAIGYIILYPLFYMIVSSISTRDAFLDPGRIWLPSSVTLENFRFTYEVMDYGNALLATLRLEVVSALIEVVTLSLIHIYWNYQNSRLQHGAVSWHQRADGV